MTSRPILARSIATIIAVAALKCSTSAADGTWNVDANGNWSAAGSWAGSVIADGADSTANFRFNLTATRTVTLDSARTIGNLAFEDLTTVSNDWVLSSSTAANVLTLDVTTGQANISIINRVATINSILAGTDGINVTAGATGGTLVLAGANTFSGGLTVTGGVVQLNNALGAGASTNTITVAPSANTAVANRLAINGGVTIGNNIVIEAGASPLAGFGAVQQVGTGQAVVNGTIMINGGVANGGHFVGGAAVGSELVLNGAITATQGVVAQRANRVIYRGGGTGYSTLILTGTGLVGATDGISTVAALTIGQSGNGTLDLNGFDQTLAGLTFGSSEAGNAGAVATVAIGARTLTLNGGINTQGNVAHAVTGTGTLALGANNATININDSAAVNDLTISTAISGSAGFTKTGSGTLILNGNVTNTGPLSVFSGSLGGNTTISGAVSVGVGATLLGGTVSSAGTVNMPTLSLDTATIGLNLGTTNDFINVTGASGLTTSGLSVVNIAPLGGPLPVGTYNLIGHNGAIQGSGLAGLALGPIGHSAATLIDTGTAVALRITSTDAVIWTGVGGGVWDIDNTQSWKLQSNNAVAKYLDGDDVIFNDTATTGVLSLDLPVTPSRVTFDNSAAVAYAISGFGGINGTALLNKTGAGSVTLQTANNYTGATTVSGGTLELDHDANGNVVLTSTSGVSVASGATLKLTRDDGGFTFNRDISGAGTVEVNPHSTASTETAQSVVLSGANTGFTGLLRLSSPATGTYRINGPTAANLGSASIEVASGAQIFTAASQTYNNSINIAGTGFADANGNIGALRLANAAVWAGPVVVNGSARIGAHDSTATVSGNISGGELTVNATNYNNNYTLIFTGTNSYGATIIGGQNTQTAGVPSMRLNIGSGGTTGTLGAGNVTINGDGANGVLGFDRADGYTLAAGQTITGAGSNLARTFIDFDTLGAGFSDNGNTITLGTATASGGNIRVAQARANAIANFSGNLTTGNFRIGTGQTGGVANFNSGAVVSANTLFIGEAANMGGTVNHASGATVNVTEQLRVGHFGTEQSVYNLNGGTLTLTGASPNNSPSTAAAGNTTTTGDNNINITNPTTIVGGGIYLGIDGTGIFNHNSGTVTTNWIVLDNRGDTGPGNNMNGLDQYNLTAGTLNIRSNWGIIGRNGSTEFNLKGGTVRVDNTGTGTGTGANITVPFDVLIRTAGNSTLDTNGAGNAFTLTRPIMGTGTIALAGGGTINLNPTGYQAVLAGLSGTNPIVKLGTGITAWRGSGSAYTGTINVSAGRLELPTNLAATSVTVADGAAVAGEPTVATVTLGATTGTTLFFDPNTAGAFKGTSLVANGTTNLDFSAVPTGAAPWTALTYTNKTGAGTFAVANAPNYRSATATDNGTGTVSVNVTRKNLTWTATGGSTWDINTTSNWDDSGTPDKFFAADTVTFGDTGAGTVTINSQVSPWGVTVNSGSAYTFSGTGGITGPGGLTKTGAGTLTIANTNTYAGQTAVNGGTLTFSAAGNLGNSSLTNTLALSGGGRLNATTGVDLGINRSIALGTGGGTIAMTNAAAQTVTISGNLTGTTPLGFTSGGAGAAAFYLTGDNSGYTGAITVDSAGGGVSTLRLGSPTAIGGGSVTLLNPISGASGNATTLDLNGYTLPTTAPLFLNASLSGANNYRSQVLSNAPGSTINSPIQISGNAGSIVQFSSNTANGMTLNGNVTAGNTGFDGSFLIRGSGQGVINGTVNLPNASVNKTDAATWTINSTGNAWLTTNIQNAGSLKLGVNNALPITATLNIGQGSDASNSTFDLNGFNQEVANLTYTAGNGNSTRGVTNTSATRSTLTVNNATDTTYGASTGITGGILAGNLDLVKNGSGTLTLAGASSFTGNVVVNSGTLVAGGATVTSLGSATTAGRMVTINSGATLSFTTNNVFGNGVNNNNLPSIALNGSTLTSTRYNVLGNLTLNGATLTQEAIDAGNYEGFQFRGNVAVTGTAASTILTTNGKANHVGPNTTFDVADVTGSAAADLTVSAPLRNQSGDFANAIGGLTKTGAGTMELSAVNTYTGSTVVNAGTLLVSGSIAGAVTANTGATLAGGGTVGPVDVAGGTVAPGAGVGTLSTGAFSLNSSAVLRFELAQAGVVGNGINDLISVTGNLTLDGTLAVTELSTLANGTYRLFTYTGTLSDQGLAIDGTFLAAHPGSLINTATAGEVSLVVIPEPTALVSLLGGMGVLLGSRRFRSSRSRRS